jgi:hypothetical protein
VLGGAQTAPHPAQRSEPAPTTSTSSGRNPGAPGLSAKGGIACATAPRKLRPGGSRPRAALHVLPQQEAWRAAKGGGAHDEARSDLRGPIPAKLRRGEDGIVERTQCLLHILRIAALDEVVEKR